MKWIFDKPICSAIAIISIGLCITSLLMLKVAGELKVESYAKIENIAKQVSIHFQDAIVLSLNDLQALKAFYSVNEQKTSLDEFNQYMNILDIEKRQYIQALSWSPVIKNEERELFEASIRKNQPDFIIKEKVDSGFIPSLVKDYYVPVTYISPYEANKSAQGFDLNSSIIRKKSLDFAKNTGAMTTTAKIRLVQEKGTSVGFLLIAPVFKQQNSVNVEEHINTLLGYVSGVFRIDSLMSSANQHAIRENLYLTLVDLDAKNGGMLYGEDAAEDAFEFNIDVPDRKWLLSVSLNSQLRNSLFFPPILQWLLAFGVTVSLLLGLVVYFLRISVYRASSIENLSEILKNKNIELEDKVNKRTQKLADNNQLLNSKIQELEEQEVILSRLMKESNTAKLIAEQRAIDLAKSNKDLDDFAYIASHDLKAPLRGIDQLAKWVVEDIEEGNLKEIPEHISTIRNRTQRLEKLLNDLLAYSRINRIKETLVLVNSAELIKELFSLLAPPENFRLTIHGSLPIFTTLSSPFEIVIRNLLNNAVKHHNKDTGHIQVRTKENKQWYIFSIEDDGPGVKADFYEDIFKMFKTLKPRDETEGSGMGLALVKKIVEYQSGKISVEPSASGGCIFHFSWPKEINSNERSYNEK